MTPSAMESGAPAAKPYEVLVPIVTPCSRQGTVDTDGLRAVCRDMLAAGCNSIFVSGSTGRGPWFSRKDRSTICSTVAAELPPGIPLLAGCMASGLPQMLENAAAAADAGASVAVVTAPGYFAYNHHEVEMIFARFADASPLPVVVYDIPDFADIKLSWEMVVRLARHGNIVGFKDSSADFARFQELAAHLVPIPGFNLLQGKERMLVRSLLAGASGFVVSLLHIDPRPFVLLYRATRAGQLELAEQVQAEIARVIGLVEASFARRPETSTLFHFLNATLRARGVCTNILLDHEEACPAWLAENAHQAVAICAAASALNEQPT